jgi:DNA-binding transcriptional LysR family regulator
MLESLSRLRLLREIGERGSLSAAARSLHLTQPAVSRQLARLEREAGVRLVDRGARRTRLTEAGAALAAHAEAVLGRVAAAEHELAALRELRGGKLRVASFPSAAATLAVDAIEAFRRAHPEVELSFADAGAADALAGLRAGTLDVALVFAHEAEPAREDGLELVPLLRDPMLVALPPDHRLASRRRIRLEELAGETWIAGTSPALTLRACREAGFEPRLRYATDHARVTHGLVAAGAGVTLLNGLGLAFAHPRIAVRPLAGTGVTRVVSAAVLGARPRLPAVAAFLEELRRAAGGYRRVSEPPAAGGGSPPSARSRAPRSGR